MKNNFNFKNILIIIAMPILGFILLNLTFVFDALFQLILRTVRIQINMHILFAIFILIISWFVLKSKLKNIYKAVYSHVPVAVILVTEGILLYKWTPAVYIVGSLTYGIIILYLYKTKKEWYFYYSVSWLTLALLIMVILGVDI